MGQSLDSGIKAFQQNKLEKALELLNDHIQTSEKDLKALYYRAMTFRRMNEHESCLLDLETAISISPNDADFISERGVTLFHLGKPREALNDLNKAQSLEPQNPYRYSSRAYILANMGQNKAAVSDYKKTIELDPNDATALNNLGLLEEKIGRKGDAEKRFEAADKITKNEPTPEKPNIDKLLKEVNDKEKKNNQPPIQAPTSFKNNKPEQLTFSLYLKTITSIFTNPEERKSFIDFVKGVFGKRKQQ